ncbi:nuclear pore membrane glycoprotein 210 [Parasteatoda tepidariorum]|uniref:nuclear pore membrane glycoprotein 210 n=1 Tax=Parasteatoda tepidariorum TaxID=114398 RepID=UPI0039BD8C57
MLFMKILSISLFVHIVYSVHGFKLNAPTILINYMYDLPSNFTLVISETNTKDCFNWQSADSSLVTVTPLFDSPLNQCSQKAVISVIGNDTSIRRTRITAIHKDDETVHLHCDVFTDVLHAIELQNMFEHVHINGPWMKISIQARNANGNVFDSINGIRFQWHSSCSNDDAEILRLRMISESNYTSAQDSDAWEIRGLLSSSIFVEGISEGSCSITASTADYKDRKTQVEVLSTSPATLIVSPNIQVYPSTELYILRHSTVDLGFRTIEGEEIEVYQKDDSIFSSSNEDVEISEDLKTVTGKNLGQTELIYDSKSERYPRTAVTVNVVEPENIEIQISRGGFTNLEEMKSYIICVHISSEGKRVIASDNLRVKVLFPSKLFHVLTSTKNGTYFHVQTLAPGSGTIKVEYKGHVLSDGKMGKEQSISTSMKVRVCHKLQIYPPFSLLPSDSAGNPLHEISLRVSGGTHNYSWGLDDRSAASISTDRENNNVAMVTVFKESDFTVSAADINNVNLLASAKVSVQPVADIEVYPTVVEAEIGNTLLLPVALLGYECRERKIIRKFDDCSKIYPTVEIVEKHILVQDEEPYVPAFGKGCLTLQFRCKSPGHSRINIFYSSNKTGEVLKTTTVLSCFKPLTAVHPIRVAVVALGANKEIAFDGGPRKWPLFKEGHLTTLEASNHGLLDIELVKDPIRYNRDLTVFRVFCKSIGETVLLFKIGNNVSATLPHPAKAETSIMLVCSVPQSLHLKVHKTNERAKKEENNIVKVPFYGDKLFSVDIWLKDSVGRKFSNISTFDIKWEVSDESIASPKSDSGVTTHENAVSGYRKVSRDFQEFKMTGLTGDLKVTAKISGYKEDILSKSNIPQNLIKVSTLNYLYFKLCAISLTKLLHYLRYDRGITRFTVAAEFGGSARNWFRGRARGGGGYLYKMKRKAFVNKILVNPDIILI